MRQVRTRKRLRRRLAAHGVDASEAVVLRKRPNRKAMMEFFTKLPPTVVVIEACEASHYLARELGKLGH
jgi:transposase